MLNALFCLGRKKNPLSIEQLKLLIELPILSFSTAFMKYEKDMLNDLIGILFHICTTFLIKGLREPRLSNFCLKEEPIP